MRLRLVNRIRQQLWFPQLPRLTGDLSTEWVHDLWKLAPTPAKNRCGRPCLFKHHRVRSAGEARRQLREPPHRGGNAAIVESVAERMLARRQLANRERLTLAADMEEPGTAGQRDVLSPLPRGSCPRHAARRTSLAPCSCPSAASRSILDRGSFSRGIDTAPTRAPTKQADGFLKARRPNQR